MTRKKAGEWYWTASFIYFLVWKLSYIVFNLNMFLDMPLSIVYFNGGTKGHFFALVILSVYLLFFALKKHPSINDESGEIYLYYFLCNELVMKILQQKTLEIILHFSILAGFLILLKKNKLSLSNQILIMIIMLKLLVSSIFHSFLSVEVLSFTWIGITMLILSTIKRRGSKF